MSAVLIASLWLLWKGADRLTHGAGSLALLYRISPIIVGLTILAIVTSLPEFLTVLISTATGNPGLGASNIIGSNICNIGLILGVAVLIKPIVTQTRLLRLELPLLVIVSALFTFLGFGGLGRAEGLLLTGGFIIYLIYVTRQALLEPYPEAIDYEAEMGKPLASMRQCAIAIVLGGIALSLGADLLVEASVQIAERLGIGPIIIGIILVAVGTSLPELAASIAAAVKNQGDLCAGNVIGSNIFNILFVGGAGAALLPLEVDSSLFRIEIPAMLLMAILLFVLFYTGGKVTRGEGLFLLLLYGIIIIFSSLSQLGMLFG